jgi:hypothetical protein
VCNSVLYLNRITWHRAGYQLPFLNASQHKADFILSTTSRVYRCDSEMADTNAYAHMHTAVLGVITRHRTFHHRKPLRPLWLGDRSLAMKCHNLHITKGKAWGTYGRRSHIGVVGYDSQQSSTKYFLSLQVKRSFQIFFNLLRIIQFQFSSSKYSNSTAFMKSMPAVVTKFLYIRYYFFLLPLEQAFCSWHFSS